MIATTPLYTNARRIALLVVFLLIWPLSGQAQAPIVHPGAPGEQARTLTAEEATDIAVTAFSPADIRFMTDMIPHHHQAMEMTVLVADRTNRPEVVDLAGRISASQGDEIAVHAKLADGTRTGCARSDRARSHAYHPYHGRHGITRANG